MNHHTIVECEAFETSDNEAAPRANLAPMVSPTPPTIVEQVVQRMQYLWVLTGCAGQDLPSSRRICKTIQGRLTRLQCLQRFMYYLKALMPRSILVCCVQHKQRVSGILAAIRSLRPSGLHRHLSWLRLGGPDTAPTSLMHLC